MTIDPEVKHFLELWDENGIENAIMRIDADLIKDTEKRRVLDELLQMFRIVEEVFQEDKEKLDLY